MEDNNYFKKKQESRIFAGLILVCVGAALLLRNTGFPLPGWLFDWPVILILVGLYSGIKHNFANKTWFILIAVGGFFLLDDLLPDINLAPYLWPVGIIGLGILFILRPDKESRFLQQFEKKNSDAPGAAGGWKQPGNSSYSPDDSDLMRVTSVFSGVQKNILSKDFKGGKISCVFGGADIDLTQSDLQQPAIIQLEIAFGGLKLIVPPHWTVHNQIDGVFHGVDDKRKFRSEQGVQPEKVLILKGSVVFGGVEIRSY